MSLASSKVFKYHEAGRFIDDLFVINHANNFSIFENQRVFILLRI